MHPKDILDLPLKPENEADASTVRDYLKELLIGVWQREESFSGKRPFGNSGWKYDLYYPLVKAGLVAGKIDEDGYVYTEDFVAAEDLIEDAIDAL